ncbi:MAG: ABC transporter permease [Deltaproteobacteria bacterium HGW-Deltaproteobacteria-14]|nr:MAG: ABC transporter permease [Deltaproteobacteria bacterium HGW-Deltaproteobacteria-14]
MGRILLIALRNVFTHTRRSLLLGGAIAFVTFLLVALFAFSSGLQANMLESATTLVSGHVNVGGFYKVSPAVARPIVIDYAKVEAVVRATSPHIRAISRRARGGFDRVTSPTTSLMNAIAGVDIASDGQLRERLEILHGDIDALREPGTALMFARQAKDLEVGVGDVVSITGLTSRGIRNRADVRVAAIAKDMGGLSQILTFIPEATLNTLYELRPENTGVLMVFLDDRDLANAVAKDIRTALRAAGYDLMEPEAKPFWQKQQNVEREDWTGQQLDVSTWRDEMGQLADIVDALDGFAIAFTFILMLVIIIGIWNTLFMAVRERTPEIGALRAIGMSRMRVRFMFLAEAGTLALLAAVSGALLAGLLVAALNSAGIAVDNPQLQFVLMSDTLFLHIDPARVAIAVLVIVLFTALAALWPAHRASKVQPGAAMSHAG